MQHRPRPIDSPFGWWQLGVGEPSALIEAIEFAMVADGYPAAGLAAHALARRATVADMRRDSSYQQERRLADPPRGLHQHARG